MQYRLFKLRLRRRIRHSQGQVADIGTYAEAGLDRHLFRRLSKLGNIWRFIVAWVLLLVILIGGTVLQIEHLSKYYQTLQPVPGGIYSEGIAGTFTNANPIYATSDVDNSVSRLVFAGLFTYDNDNKLVPDLARSLDVDTTGTIYTAHLKPNLTWQDGSRLTADDVIFTFHAIQNPDAQSPLAGSWQGVTVTKKDAYTVTFTLANPLASFPYSLTTGIIPAQAFAGLPASSWRSADFNSLHPIGAGPFAWDALQVKRVSDSNKQILIALKPFAAYTLGEPKLNSFVVHAFTDRNVMIDTFEAHQLSAMIPPEWYTPDAGDNAVHTYSFVLTAASMIFFNTSSGVMADQQVRHALVQGTDASALQKLLGYPTKAVREPLLNGQVGYDPSLQQAAYDRAAARAALDKDGWLVGKDGVRYKDGKPLAISLVASDSTEHRKLVRGIKADWQRLGAQVTVLLLGNEDFQNTLAAHNYDAVLYGISIGVDPDVFVYWDSTQSDPRSTRLNLSLYKSATADTALEAGRTRLDPALRTIKYRPFLQAWQQDAPGMGLFQPRYRYLTHQTVYGLDAKVLNSGVDRLNNVQNWQIQTSEVTND